MSLFSELMILAVSLTGILSGIALSYISPEELVPGKKYFLLLKRLITILIFVLAICLSFFEKNYFLLIPAILILVLSIISFKIKKINVWYSEWINYFLFTGIYLLSIETNFKLLTATLIFIYGLPLGSMIRKLKHEK